MHATCSFTGNKKPGGSIKPHPHHLFLGNKKPSERHFLGKSWDAYATSSDNQDTIPLIHIPDWDFHWQGIYTYPSLVHIPEGYTVHAIASYDNTSSNPFNPNNPPQPMSFGDFTTDEMYVMFLQYVEYQEGDEDITFSNVQENHFVYNDSKLFPAWPNPAASNSSVTVGFHVPQSGVKVSINLYDINGRVVATWLDGVSYSEGYHLIKPQIDGLAPGSYTYRLTTSDGHASSKVLQISH